MNFEDPLFLLSITCGITFVMVGWLMLRFPPLNRNNLYGYRTARSMKNDANWKFAQPYSAKEMMKGGVILLLTAVIAPLVDFTNTLSMVIGIAITTIVVVMLFVKTERALKRFEKEIQNERD